jgi:hypothetical protein
MYRRQGGDGNLKSTGLPTRRTTPTSNFRLTAMCRACRRIADVDLAIAIGRGMGDVPIIHLRLHCSNCRSKLCDGVVSGLHFHADTAMIV